jgi:hypothetical protein
MIAPRMAGFMWSHSAPSALVTVTKSVPKNTPVTLSTAKMRLASGDLSAVSAEGKSAVPISSTDWPGRNFSVAGFGVDSVWMNIGRDPPSVRSDMRSNPGEVKIWNDSKTAGMRAQVICSSCSLDNSPGTMVIGTGSEPACFVSAVTSGPGPPLPEPAPRTRTPISGVSRTWARIWSNGSPSRTTSEGPRPAGPASTWRRR